MYKYLTYINLVLSLISYSVITASISLSQLSEKYSLVIQATDATMKKKLILIPGEILAEKKLININDNFNTYEDILWDDIAQMWQDFRSPQDVGCYIFDTIEPKYNRVTLKLPVLSSDNSYQIILADNIKIVKIGLILNEFINECILSSFSIKKTPCLSNLSVSSFTDLLDEDDESEIQEYMRNQSEPSSIVIFARKIGIALFLKYVAIRDYMMNRFFNKTRQKCCH